MTIAAIADLRANWNYDRALALYRELNPDPFLLSLFEAGSDPYNERKLRTLLESIIEDTFDEAGLKASKAGEKVRSLFEDTVHRRAQGSHSAIQAKLDIADANPYDNHHLPSGQRNLVSLPSSLRQDTVDPRAKASLTGNLAKPDYPAVKPSDARPLVDYHSAPQEVKLIISERIAAFNRAKLLFENLREDGDPEEEKQMALEILSLRKMVDDYWEQLNYYAQHKVLPPELDDPHAGWTEGKLKDRQRNLRTYITHAKAGRRKADKLEEWELELALIERRLADGNF